MEGFLLIMKIIIVIIIAIKIIFMGAEGRIILIWAIAKKKNRVLGAA
jgi:hypothetical protein